MTLLAEHFAGRGRAGRGAGSGGSRPTPQTRVPYPRCAVLSSGSERRTLRRVHTQALSMPQTLDPGRFSPRLARREVVGNLLEGCPLHAGVAVYVVDQALQHKEVLRPARDVRVYGETVHRVVHLAVDPVELVAPQVFDVPRVHEAVAIGGVLDEHHGRQVVQVPVRGDLDEVYLLASLERLHPLGGGLRIIDLGPRVALASVVGGEVVVLQRTVVLVIVLEQDLVSGIRGLPPRRRVAGRLLAGKVFNQLDTLLYDVPLLLRGHRDWILVRVAVAADLMPGIYDRLALIRERLYRMPRHHPCGLDVVLLEELQEPWRADFTGEHAS